MYICVLRDLQIALHKLNVCQSAAQTECVPICRLACKL